MEEHISLEIAKQLTDLGMKFFCLEYWVAPTELMPGNEFGEAPFELLPYNQGLDSTGGDLDGLGDKEITVRDFYLHPNEFWDIYPAYNFAEIRAIVPYNVVVNENVKEIGYSVDDTPVDKWGKLLIYLIKNYMVSFDDIKGHYS